MPVNNKNTSLHYYMHEGSRAKDGTGSRVTGSPGQRFWPGRSAGSRVSVSDPIFDPVWSFNMRVYRGVVSTE